MRKLIRRDLEMPVLLMTGKLPIHSARVLALRCAGVMMTRSTTVYHGLQIRHPRGLSLGARTSIGEDCILDARGGLVIGADVNLSSQVHIWTAQHDWRAPGFAYTENSVAIGDRAWLGDRVIVLPGVSIGVGAVIGAGSVVSRDVPEWSLSAGVPAVPIRKRDPTDYRLPGRTSKVLWW